MSRLTVELPPAFRALQQRMLKTPGGDREMVEILALVLQHDEQAVLAAVELALEAGAPTKTHILNLLHRLGRRQADGRAAGESRRNASGVDALNRRPTSSATTRCAKPGAARHAS